MILIVVCILYVKMECKFSIYPSIFPKTGLLSCLLTEVG